MDMDNMSKDDDGASTFASLNEKQIKFLSQMSHDIRTTVSHLSLPDVSPLSVLDAAAIDSLKDLYYALNSEDPLNAMPIRRHVLDTNMPLECLIPIAAAASADPAADRNKKRWSLPTYQTLRLFSVLTLPIAADNELPVPTQLDYLLLDLRFRLANHRKSLSPYVSLLEYYVDRKAEKRAACAPAEDSKLEDARIDNILRFFCNILSPPRRNVGNEIAQRDRAVHLALVGSLVSVDFFSTLTVLFSTAEDAHAHYTDLVFLIANIFSFAYRHTSPQQMIRMLRGENVPKDSPLTSKPPDSTDPEPQSVFDEPSERRTEALQTSASKHVSRQASVLRDTLSRERAAIGGSRAATVGARWSSRHSGGIVRTVKKPGDIDVLPNGMRTPNGFTKASIKQIVSAKGAVQSNKTFNPRYAIQENIRTNSELLCLFAAKKRNPSLVKGVLKQTLPTVRHDLQVDGLKGLVAMTMEMIDVSFQFFLREFRDRITETRETAKPDEKEALQNAERSFLTIVGSIVGFHRERCGKVYKSETNPEEAEGLCSQIHQIDIKMILTRDFKIVKTAWKHVEAAIELESFQMVFSVLADACHQIKEAGKDDRKVELVELSTFSVLEMMKMLQGMAAVVPKEVEEADEAKQGDLTPRELALNTLEQLFENESFLNAPADLAKIFTAKLFSFLHLSNIVEMAHTFTTILLAEREFSHLTVAVSKRRRKTRSKKVAESKDDIEGAANENFTDKIKSSESARDSDATEVAPDERDETKEATDSEILQLSKNDTLFEQENANANPVMGMEGAEGPNEENTSEQTANTTQPRELSRVKKMLLADEETRAAQMKDLEADKEMTKVQKMLLADRRADTDGVPKPKYVTSLDGEVVDEKDLAQVRAQNIAPEQDEGGEEAVREVESIGIVRRFAHVRAIETLLIPLRVAICQACELSGKAFATPEGVEVVSAPTVVAKSASVIRAIWKVSHRLERGTLCAQFFSFSVMHFLGIALSAESEGANNPKSILSHIAGLAKEVTDEFFKWLLVNPGLMYDMFMLMDKTYTLSFARKVVGENQPKIIDVKKGKNNRKKKVVEDGQEMKQLPSSPELWEEDEFLGGGYEDGDGSSDVQNLPESLKKHDQKETVRGPGAGIAEDEDVDIDGLNFESQKKKKVMLTKRQRMTKTTPTARNKRHRRQRSVTLGLPEDEDVEDVDNLRFGNSSSDDDKHAPEISQKLLNNPSHDAESNDDDSYN